MKPFYALLHPELAKEYEWWGFSDIDLVYGDLSSIVNERNLSKFNLISTHIKCTAGHFTIMRTNSRYSSAAQEVPGWKEALENEKPMWFDETPFSNFIRPRQTKIIDKLWYSAGHRIGIDRNKFYRFFEKLLPWKTDTLLVEPDTTFKPIPGAKYKFNPSTNEFYIPGALDIPSLKPGWYKMPYLHFLYFKKVFYYDTPHYWKPGFYQLGTSNPGQIDEIIITTDRIGLNAEE